MLVDGKGSNVIPSILDGRYTFYGVAVKNSYQVTPMSLQPAGTQRIDPARPTVLTTAVSILFFLT